MTQRVLVYPGSFNPLHIGHMDVAFKALGVADIVVMLQLFNPDKPQPAEIPQEAQDAMGERFVFCRSGLWLRDWLRNWTAVNKDYPVVGIVRGLRNTVDFEESCRYQWANEALGVELPFLHFIADRQHLHMSSTFCRELTKAGIPHGFGQIKEP